MKQGGRPRRAEEHPDSPFGEALKEHLRRVKNFTQAELAKESLIAEKTLSNMVKGKRESGITLRRDLRAIIRVLYYKQALQSLDEANRLITHIPTIGPLDERDPEDAEIIALFKTAEGETLQTPNQQSGAAPGLDDDFQSEPGVSVSNERKEKRSRGFIFVGIGLALIVISGVITYFIYFAHQPATRLGGGWISPIEKTVKSRVYFAAYAYPMHEGDPAIDHVDFTLYWQGVDPRKWVIACVSRKPSKKDIFSCTADLHALGAPAGEVRISFDVYDRQGNHNNAPNGVHTVTYSP